MRFLSRWRSLADAVLLGLAALGCGYNTVPTLEEEAKAKSAEVQSQFQRRADLIPNLVAAVQGYAKQAKDALTSVVEARASATQIKLDASSLTGPEKLGQFQEAQAQLSSALARLLMVTENYPDLESNANFLARRDYIQAVRDFSISLRALPTLLWAKTFFSGTKPMAEFAANEAAQTAPQVKL